jgi:hypothetical protein
MSTVYATEGSGKASMSNKFKLMAIVSIFFVLILILTLVFSMLKKTNNESRLTTFSNSWFSISYPIGFSPSGTYVDMKFTSNKGAVDFSETLTVTRLGQASKLPKISDFSKTIAEKKPSSISVNGRKALFTEIKGDTSTAQSYYVFDPQFIWKLEFDVSSKSELSPLSQPILDSFNPKQLHGVGL